MRRLLLAFAAALLGAGCATHVRVETQSQPAQRSSWLFVREDGQPALRVFATPGQAGTTLLRLDVIRDGRAMTTLHTLDPDAQLGTPDAQQEAALKAAFEEAARAASGGRTRRDRSPP